ncbi:hypothetical protein QQP08_001142 [Theobroma cacao]|nr:hypothetical protein QQP08_001142 [Theobroma cacao]
MERLRPLEITMISAKGLKKVKHLSKMDVNSTKYVTYPVKKPCGKPKGELNFLFRFGEKTLSAVTAYPVGGIAMNYPPYPQPHNAAVPAYPPVGYPPVGFQQPVQEGYKPASAPPAGFPPMGPAGSYPPPPAGYPPVGPGYGYPPVVQPERRNENGDGLALGAAALLGGLLGGILLGDMVADAAADCDPYANAADYI